MAQGTDTHPMRFALTYHVEGSRSCPSEEIYSEIEAQVRLADDLGFNYAWFAEHHAHIHLGHMPCPLLLALHLAARTRRIHLGTAVTCLNMHPAVAVAEQVMVADLLTGGRISPGFGSGSTPEELQLYGLPHVDAETRHARFADSLRAIRAMWAGDTLVPADGQCARYGPPLPRAKPDLLARSWVAANSLEAARIAGAGGHNLMFSFLRTPEHYETLYAAYRDAGGCGRVAANRPVYVGEEDGSAWEEAEPALRILWRRFQSEGKIPSDRAEPRRFEIDNTPGQFLVGSPATVAAYFDRLRERVPFDTVNIEPRWEGLPPTLVHESLGRFARSVIPRLARRA